MSEPESAVAMSISPSPAPQVADAPPPPADEPTPPFRLLDLPVEIVLLVISHVNSRPYSASFPCGPPVDLLRLSETSRFFLSTCRPRIWSAISYAPIRAEQLATPAFRHSRSLSALNEIVRACQAEEGKERSELFPPLPLVRLSVHGSDDDEEWMMARALQASQPQTEDAALVELVTMLGQSKMLQVLFVAYQSFTLISGADFLRAVVEGSPALSAIRFNCVDGFFNKFNFDDLNPNFDNLRTIQIMHGHRSLVNLTRLAPNLESLLLWPRSRRLGDLGDHIASKLGQLRNLSIDAVHEPAVFSLFADAINGLAAKREFVPLEELFLEGPQVPAERDALIASLKQTNVQRLALYHLRKATPALVESIVAACPQLRALTLVQGDTSEAVRWPASLDQYTAQLKKLRNLSFFAFDRKAPQPDPRPTPPVKQMVLEYKALSELGVACAKLREAVAIFEDVSEGSEGYFATFERQRGKVKIQLKKRRVQDFLISFNRWCIVAE